MIRILLATMSSLALAWGEVSTLADFLPELSSEKFEVRKTAMEKLRIYAQSNPEKTLREVVPILKMDLDPEARLRIREVACNLIVATKKSQFGFFFNPINRMHFKGVPATGIQIIEVRLDTPAKRCGLEINDIILAVNDTPFPRTFSQDQIQEVFATQVPGKEVKLTIQRQGKQLDLFATPMKVPLERDALLEAHRKFDAWLQKETANEAPPEPGKATAVLPENNPLEDE